MKTIILSAIMVLCLSSCRKCFICEVPELVNGHETGRAFKDKYCIDKDDRRSIEAYRSIQGCNETI